MQTTDGEALLLGKSYYVLRDADAVRARLNGIPDLDADDEGGFEALHAIGSVVAEQLFKVMKEGAPIDRPSVARSLARLRPDAWRFSRS